MQSLKMGESRFLSPIQDWVQSFETCLSNVDMLDSVSLDTDEMFGILENTNCGITGHDYIEILRLCCRLMNLKFGRSITPGSVKWKQLNNLSKFCINQLSIERKYRQDILHFGCPMYEIEYLLYGLTVQISNNDKNEIYETIIFDEIIEFLHRISVQNVALVGNISNYCRVFDYLSNIILNNNNNGKAKISKYDKILKYLLNEINQQLNSELGNDNDISLIECLSQFSLTINNFLSIDDANNSPLLPDMSGIMCTISDISCKSFKRSIQERGIHIRGDIIKHLIIGLWSPLLIDNKESFIYKFCLYMSNEKSQLLKHWSIDEIISILNGFYQIKNVYNFSFNNDCKWNHIASNCCKQLYFYLSKNPFAKKISNNMFFLSQLTKIYDICSRCCFNDEKLIGHIDNIIFKHIKYLNSNSNSDSSVEMNLIKSILFSHAVNNIDLLSNENGIQLFDWCLRYLTNEMSKNEMSTVDNDNMFLITCLVPCGFALAVSMIIRFSQLTMRQQWLVDRYFDRLWQNVDIWLSKVKNDNFLLVANNDAFLQCMQQILRISLGIQLYNGQIDDKKKDSKISILGQDTLDQISHFCVNNRAPYHSSQSEKQVYNSVIKHLKDKKNVCIQTNVDLHKFGLEADILLNNKIVINVDGPTHYLNFSRKEKQLTGKDLYRNWLIKCLGYKLYCVPTESKSK